MEIVNSQKLKDMMLEKCIGVSTLAKAAGIQNSIVSRLIKADRPAHLPTISKLAKALGVEPTTLILEE